MASIKLFGFTLGKKEVTQVAKPEQPSFTLPQQAIEDGAVTITQGAHYGTYVDLEGSVRNELELITRYREMSLHPECDAAIEEIINQGICRSKEGKIISLNMDRLKQPDSIKKKITEEFENVLRMLNFSNLAEDLFKRWYVDGRIYYHVVVDESRPREGIKELRFIDPRKIRKVREIFKKRDPKTNVEIISGVNEYYVYNDRGISTQTYTSNTNQGVRIATDSIIHVTSGLMDAKNVMVISYLHKAIKNLNQLRMIEDAIVIYRLSRAPERRIFYIDVGNLPKGKAEQYLYDIMVKYRNKLVYDANTGEIRDERKHLSMLEDFWLPRREGGRGTEITTLPGGQNLGEIEDIKYFQRKLFQSLNVPISRLDVQTGGSFVGIGRTTEVTRDELKFSRFVNKLRARFSHIFDHALRVQLSLKGICTTEEWEDFKEFINYEFEEDNNFAEMKDAELLRERVNTITLLDPYVGKYFSQEWIKKNVLYMTDEEIEEMHSQIEEEANDKRTTYSLDPQTGQPVTAQDLQAQQDAAMQQQTSGGATVDQTQQPQDQSQPQNAQQQDAGQSLTPDLDAEVLKFTKNINKRK